MTEDELQRLQMAVLRTLHQHTGAQAVCVVLDYPDRDPAPTPEFWCSTTPYLRDDAARAEALDALAVELENAVVLVREMAQRLRSGDDTCAIVTVPVAHPEEN